ncbi:S8 family serine peptidase [Streptomyces sp. NPDC002309]
MTSVLDPQGGPAGAHVMSVGDDTYVYPDAAVPFIASGALDERLFNVTELLEAGYDDARSDRLPLIVTYTDAAVRSRSTKTPEGARKTLTLSSVQGAAISAEHRRAADFWSSLTGGESASAAAASQPSGRLAGGIAKVWLDGKVKATLSDTTAQIGAPAVWESGNTGEGVDVAVLDTGIDAGHPDFEGRIAATRSFVPDEDVTDGNGHGTHVASTVAGTGAAAGGTEKGVAPGARLHIGKVLSDKGEGGDSSVLAGMEWAARDQHAKIISMSLGGEPTDGTDLLSQAVNRLSEETGALFVVAAGNSGPGARTVGAPGAADAALTVGAVNGPGRGVDQLAVFSSRGPRVGDNGLKPDLTAPGVDVLAARSQFAEGEGAYTTMSGTSMATPHVAGAAALLAAEHPDWTGRQLKDALVSTTTGTSRYSPYQGGAGRLDIAAATKATLIAPTSVFSQARYPYAPGQTAREDVTYTNTADTPVTVDLALAGPPGLPEGLFGLSADRLTVPAHGTATVEFLTHLDRGQDNAAYSSFLTATGPDGKVLTRTPVGVNKQGQRVTLSVTTKHRGGGLPGIFFLKDIERNTVPEVYTVDASGTLDLTLVPSTYAAWMIADVPGVDGTHALGLGVLPVPQIDLSESRTLSLDTSRLRKAAALTPQETANGGFRVDQYRSYGDRVPYGVSYLPEHRDYDSLWLLPTEKVTRGAYGLHTRWRQVQPPLTFASGSQTYDDVAVQSNSPVLPEGTGGYRAVWLGDGSAEDFRKAKVRGRVVVVRRSDTVPAPDQAKAAAEAGARQLLILNDGYGRLAHLLEAPPLPVATLGADDSARLLTRLKKPGTDVLKVVSHPYPHYLYDLVRRHDGAVPSDPSYRPGPGDLARIDDSFRDTRQGRVAQSRWDLSFSGVHLGVDPTLVPAQGKLTSWVTADPDLTWMSTASADNTELIQSSTARSYKPRSVSGEVWFSPVLHPRFVQGGDIATPFRAGEGMSTSIVTAWGDSGGHAGTSSTPGATKVSLYQGDNLLAENTNDGLSINGLAPEPLPYRLVVEGERAVPGRPYSPRTRTEWGYTSASPDDVEIHPLPLIQLDYAVATDLSGRAHRRTGLAVTPSHFKGAPGAGSIRTVTLEVSYDDGATWHRTPMRAGGDDWRTSLHAPRRAQFASLRTTATDDSGNTVSQTVIRAFGLK